MAQTPDLPATSKTGEAGFNFGTCHPYRPITPAGEVLPILELHTPTQDLHVFAPEELVTPLLLAATRHYGVLHLLFHPAHADKPNVADSLVRLAASHPPVGEIPPVEHKETIERQVEARVARYVYHNEGKLLLPSEAETHKHDNS